MKDPLLSLIEARTQAVAEYLRKGTPCIWHGRKDCEPCRAVASFDRAIVAFEEETGQRPSRIRAPKRTILLMVLSNDRAAEQGGAVACFFLGIPIILDEAVTEPICELHEEP